jgi:death-on-curing protein
VRNVEWLLDDVVEAIHERQLAEHGGRPGLRDHAARASAPARPHNVPAYADRSDLAVLAAACAYGIARNHPFVDGNKRTALVAALLFLRLNGSKVEAAEEEKYRLVMSLAQGSIDEQQLTRWFQARVREA